MNLSDDQVSELMKLYNDKLESQLVATEPIDLEPFEALVRNLDSKIVPKTYEHVRYLVFKIFYQKHMRNTFNLTDGQLDYIRELTKLSYDL